MTHTVELSDDRKEMTIHSGDGKRTAHLRSARPHGFTDEEAFKALTFDFAIEPPNERTVAWRKHIVGSWWLYAAVIAGPPTWWWPRIKVGSAGVLIGWLRRAFQAKVKKEADDD